MLNSSKYPIKAYLFKYKSPNVWSETPIEFRCKVMMTKGYDAEQPMTGLMLSVSKIDIEFVNDVSVDRLDKVHLQGYDYAIMKFTTKPIWQSSNTRFKTKQQNITNVSLIRRV